jgi:hypothetical protein
LAEDNGMVRNVTVTQDVVQFSITIHYNVITKQYALSGCDADPLVALGMLEWAKHRVQRGVAMAEMAEEMRRRPVVVPPGLRGV